MEPEQCDALLDLVWSDTYEVEGSPTSEHLAVEWKPNPKRGCSYFYGYKVTREFLDRNDLLCIVRAHEVQDEGFKRHFDLNAEDSNSLPAVFTVFSAPNYCDTYRNKAAVLRIGMWDVVIVCS